MSSRALTSRGKSYCQLGLPDVFFRMQWIDGWMDGWVDGWMDGWMDPESMDGLKPKQPMTAQSYCTCDAVAVMRHRKCKANEAYRSNYDTCVWTPN
jgi:hypothetical protein